MVRGTPGKNDDRKKGKQNLNGQRKKKKQQKKREKKNQTVSSKVRRVHTGGNGVGD